MGEYRTAQILIPTCSLCLNKIGPDGAMAMSSVNWLVGTGFVSRYRLQPRVGVLKAQWVGVRPLHPLFLSY